MFTRKRLVPITFTGDWPTDSPALTKWLCDYQLSLEQSGALSIDSDSAGRPYNLKNDFGAAGDGVRVDTAAFVAAITACVVAGKDLYVPGGDYLVTTADAIVFPDNFSIYGDGKRRTRIIFNPTSAGACFKVSAGASRVNQFRLSGIGFYSTDTTTQKIALDLYDISVVRLQDVLIYGSGGSGPSSGACWAGATSYGIRFHGREAFGAQDIEIVADRAVYFAANPNTAAADLEDCDHFNFHNCYLIGNGNPIIEFAAGLGASHLSFTGYQAWVGGTAGIKMNDTRSGAGVLRSRHIYFENVRHEQCTDSSGYAFDLTFTSRVEQIGFKNILVSATSNGIKLAGYEHCSMVNVAIAGATGTSLNLTAPISASTLSFRNCTFPSGSTATISSMTPTMIAAYRTADFAAPQSADYSGQISGSAVSVEKVRATQANGSVAIVGIGTTGDGLQVIPNAAGSGVTLRAVNNGETDFEPAVHVAESYDFQYRTGAATAATGVSINTSGNLTAHKKLVALGPDSGVAAKVMSDGSGDGLQVLPQGAGSGAVLRAVNNGESDFEPMTLVAETFDLRYRTGAATSASMMSSDTSGNVTFAGIIACNNTVSSISPTSPNRTIAITVGGTIYYLHAKTTND